MKNSKKVKWVGEFKCKTMNSKRAVKIENVVEPNLSGGSTGTSGAIIGASVGTAIATSILRN